MAPLNETQARAQAHDDLTTLISAFYGSPGFGLEADLSTDELWPWLRKLCQETPVEQLLFGDDRARFASMLQAGAVNRLARIIIDYTSLGRIQGPALGVGENVSGFIAILYIISY